MKQRTIKHFLIINFRSKLNSNGKIPGMKVLFKTAMTFKLLKVNITAWLFNSKNRKILKSYSNKKIIESQHYWLISRHFYSKVDTDTCMQL